MRGLGKLQISQMKKDDARVALFFSELRSILDLLEDIVTHPYVPPVTAPEPAAKPALPIDLVPEKIAYSIKEVRRLISVSNAKIYSEIKKNRLRSSKVGGRTLILAKDLQAWIETWSVR